MTTIRSITINAWTNGFFGAYCTSRTRDPRHLHARRAIAVRMTSAQFREAIAKVGLSQEAAGVFFGRSKRTGQAWALGEIPVPEYVARFLRLMIRLKLTPDDVR